MGDPITTLIITIASAAYQQIKQRKLKQKMEAEADKRKGLKFTIEGQATELPVVYGKQALGGIDVSSRVSGFTRTFTNDSDKAFSINYSTSFRNLQKNNFLFVQTALCHSGIEGVQHILVNDIDYRGTTIQMVKGKSDFRHYIATYNTEGVSNIATTQGFPTTDRFTRAAHVFQMFELNREDQNYSGKPSMQYLVKGMRVRSISYDAFNDTYSLGTSLAYSNNPAYCLLDYLLNPVYGRGLDASEVDLESFYKAANLCDIVVIPSGGIAGQVNSTKPLFSYPEYSDFPVELEPFNENYLYKDISTNQVYSVAVSGTGVPTYTLVSGSPSTEDIRLYECNLTLNTGDTVRDNIYYLLETMGTADLVWTPEGKYKLILQYPQSDIEQNALVVETFDKDNIIRDNIGIKFPSAEEKFNQITISFDNEFEDFKEDSVAWPPYSSDPASLYQAFFNEDGGQPYRTSMSGTGITTPYHALALAEQMVRKSRNIYTLKLTVGREGLKVEPGDLIRINLDTAGINNEIFRVESIEINTDFTVNISCFYFDYNYLAWNIGDGIAYPERPVIDFDVASPSNVTFTQGESVFGLATGLLEWTIADDVSVAEYDVHVSNDGGATFYIVGSTPESSFEVNNLSSGTYVFAVSSRTIRGRSSNLAQSTSYPVTSKNAGYNYISVYKRSNTAPTIPSGGVFNWVTGQVTTDPSGWSASIPEGESPLYVSNASITTEDPADTAYAISGWLTPRIIVDGPWPAVGGVLSGMDDWHDYTELLEGEEGWRMMNDIGIHTLRPEEAVRIHIGHSSAGSDYEDILNTIQPNDYLTLNVNTNAGPDNGRYAYRIISANRRENYTLNFVAGQYYYDFEVQLIRTNGVVGEVSPTAGLSNPVFDFSRNFGLPGEDGVAGSRGAAWFRYQDVTNAAAYYDDDTKISTALGLETGLTPVENDKLIIACTDIAIAFRYVGGTWVTQDDFIDGNLMVAGTITGDKIVADSITADKLNVTTLESLNATIGTLRTASSGARLELTDNVIRVYDTSGTLRVKIGNLA